MRCANHPDIETSLRCGKCDKPICPKCMVQTPVGARCSDCARLYQLPTYHVSTKHYLQAAGVALGMAIVCGLAWGVVEWVVPLFSLNLLLAPGVGFALGEVVSLAINRKRGRGLATIGGIGLIVSYLVSLWFLGLLSGTSFGEVMPVTPVNSIYHLLALGLGIFLTISRLR